MAAMTWQQELKARQLQEQKGALPVRVEDGGRGWGMTANPDSNAQRSFVSNRGYLWWIGGQRHHTAEGGGWEDVWGAVVLSRGVPALVLRGGGGGKERDIALEMQP